MSSVMAGSTVMARASLSTASVMLEIGLTPIEYETIRNPAVTLAAEHPDCDLSTYQSPLYRQRRVWRVIMIEAVLLDGHLRERSARGCG